MVAPRVFLDFTVDNAPLGRVIFELYNISAPKTAENFRALCTGEKGISPVSQVPLYYKNCLIHRVIPDFMIQGGDFTKRNGTGGESIYGAPFADEDLSRPVDEPGLLVMANKGPNTNGSQFFITLRPCPHLNGKHVVFGRVIRGFEEVVNRIATLPTDAKDRPTTPVVISSCGELELRRPPPRQPSPSESASSEESERSRGRKKRNRSPSESRSRSRSRSRSSIKSESRSRSRSRSRGRLYSRSKSRSRSRSVSSSDSEAEARRWRKERKRLRKEKKKEKKAKKAKKKKHRSGSPSDPEKQEGALDGQKAPHEETEEEYDARLEREERERIEAARKRELEEIRRRYAEEREKAETQDGIRYKGRGRMKYMDPETRSRRHY